MLRYAGAALPVSFAAMLCAWAAPASATVCLPCTTVACELVVETVSDCQVVPSNHEIVVRATCPGLISLDALPLVRRTNGEAVPGLWEPLSGYGVERFRLVGAVFPPGEELLLVGEAPQRCYMTDLPSCTTPQLQCLPDDLEPKDCCALYSEAALNQTSAGQGGQSGQGGQGGQGGSDGGLPDEPIWLRFFAAEEDATPPMAQPINPVCTGDGVDNRKLYWDAPGPFDDIQQVRFIVESDADAEALLVLQSRTPCLKEPELVSITLDGMLDFGVHRVRMEYRDWSGNVTQGPERVLQVPEDCVDVPVGDRSFSCEKPTYPFDQACLEHPLPPIESVPSGGLPNFCSLLAGSPDDDVELPDIGFGDSDSNEVPLGTGGSSAGHDVATDSPVTPRGGAGCACSTTGRAGYGESARATFMAGICIVLLLRRNGRRLRVHGVRNST